MGGYSKLSPMAHIYTHTVTLNVPITTCQTVPSTSARPSPKHIRTIHTPPLLYVHLCLNHIGATADVLCSYLCVPHEVLWPT